MADWSLLSREWPSNRSYDTYEYTSYSYNNCYPEQQLLVQQVAAQYFAPQAQPYCLPSSPAQSLLPPPPLQQASPPNAPVVTLKNNYAVALKGDNPREIRNKAEKQRRDKLNHSISELASMVPPVVAASRKIDKTGVLRLTAHYLRSHQYVFGDTINRTTQEINSKSALVLLQLLNGFLLTITYRGIVVVVSQNVQQYLGYSELDLLGQNIFNITHEDDHQTLREQIMPSSHFLGSNGELLIPDEPDGSKKVADALAKDKRRFIVRFKKLSQRSEPPQYVTCYVEGSLRKSDRACRGYSQCCQKLRRARTRSDNVCSSGNDVVFIGVVRPRSETFITESEMEYFRMEYRTRHSIDGEIIQCEHRISLVTGYMTHEVNGVNAMNFMHRDDVRWVIIALREMYDQHRLYGESCYRLMTKNGQFIYMRTRGRLEVDHDSRAVTSFICTNTVVEEEEGKHLIKMMKKKFTLMVNNNEEPPQDEDTKEVCDNQTLPVEDPRQLEKVILHLVTNLPSPQPEENTRSVSPERGASPPLHLSIIPPRKEKIVSAIEKIYDIIKSFKKEAETNMKRNIKEEQKNKKSSLNRNKTSNRKISLRSTQSLRPTSPSSSLMPTTTNNAIQHHDNHSQAPNQKQLHDQISSDKPCFHGILDDKNKCNVLSAHSSQYVDADTVFPTSSVSSAYKTPPMTDFNNVSSSSGLNVPLNNSELVATKSFPTWISPQDINQSRNLDLLPNSEKSSGIGLKRPNDNEEVDMMVKKKHVEDEINFKINNLEETLKRISPSLESLLNETILNTQFPPIETSLNSLEQTIDPFFPDLLEVQNILDDIEEEPGEEIDKKIN